jgi:hypothetical protein
MVGIAGDICFALDVIKGTGLLPGYDVWKWPYDHSF